MRVRLCSVVYYEIARDWIVAAGFVWVIIPSESAEPECAEQAT